MPLKKEHLTIIVLTFTYINKSLSRGALYENISMCHDDSLQKMPFKKPTQNRMPIEVGEFVIIYFALELITLHHQR